jgi:ligand-binding sensor domain-containing protein
MVRSLAVLLILCACFAVSESAYSQFRNYSFQQFTEQQGLPQDFVYSLTQDSRGFLWIGTGKGLARYDGYEMKHYSVEDSLSADFITADFRTSSGNLIFGHNQGGITLFDGIGFHSILPDTLGNKVVSITEDASNNLWIAMQSNGFLYTDITTERFTPVFPDVLKGQIINTTFSRGSILFVGTTKDCSFSKFETTPLSCCRKKSCLPTLK